MGGLWWRWGCERGVGWCFSALFLFFWKFVVFSSKVFSLCRPRTFRYCLFALLAIKFSCSYRSIMRQYSLVAPSLSYQSLLLYVNYLPRLPFLYSSIPNPNIPAEFRHAHPTTSSTGTLLIPATANATFAIVHGSLRPLTRQPCWCFSFLRDFGRGGGVGVEGEEEEVIVEGKA